MNRISLVVIFLMLMIFPVTLASFGSDDFRNAPATEVVSFYHTSSPECTDEV